MPVMNARLWMLFAVVAGVIVRVAHLFAVDPHAPFFLGGLYYEFAQQILDHGFRLPETIPYYTSGGIPFAYPPLAFYVEALLLPLVPRFWLANVLPPVAASLSVIALARLAWRYFPNKWAAVAATLCFAMFHRAWFQQVEAGGLAEAFGTLTLVGLTWFLIKPEETCRDAVGMGVMIGLNFLASPGTALAAGLAALLYLGKHVLAIRPQRIARESVQILLAGGVSIALISLFVVPVVYAHGWDIFLTPLRAQLNAGDHEMLPELLGLRNFGTSDSALWIVLAGVGLWWALARRRLALLAWTMGLIVMPREGGWMMVAPAALVMGGGAVELLAASSLPLLRQSYGSVARLVPVVIALLCLAVTADGARSMIKDRLRDQDFILYPPQAEALEWVKANLPSDAHLIMLGNEAMLEWGGQMTERVVLNTPYGAEWQPEEADIAWKFREEIWACGEEAACYGDQIDRYYGEHSAVYVISDSKHGKDGKSHEMADYAASTLFAVVYRDDDIVIARYRP